MMAEQQRLRTVSGGLESLSVWDDSETDRRLRRLGTGEDRSADGRGSRRSCGSRRRSPTHISGEPSSQERSRDLRPLRLSTRSPPSSLRLRLVGGGVLLSSCRDSRSMLL